MQKFFYLLAVKFVFVVYVQWVTALFCVSLKVFVYSCISLYSEGCFFKTNVFFPLQIMTLCPSCVYLLSLWVKDYCGVTSLLSVSFRKILKMYNKWYQLKYQHQISASFNFLFLIFLFVLVACHDRGDKRKGT